MHLLALLLKVFILVCLLAASYVAFSCYSRLSKWIHAHKLVELLFDLSLPTVEVPSPGGEQINPGLGITALMKYAC